MKICLSTKHVLAHDLTMEQATKLIDKIREKGELFKDDTLCLSSQKDSNKWYVYILVHPMTEDFINNPNKYLFEVADG